MNATTRPTRYTVRAIPVRGAAGQVSGFLYGIRETRSRSNPDILSYYDDRHEARDAVARMIETDRANGLANSYTHEHDGTEGS